MIERHWKGVAKEGRADEYIAHLQHDTFIQLAAIPGFISTRILKRRLEEGVEFLIVTEWESLEAIKGFAGLTIDKSVVPERVRDMMIRYDDIVDHYERV